MDVVMMLAALPSGGKTLQRSKLTTKQASTSLMNAINAAARRFFFQHKWLCHHYLDKI